MLFILPYIKSLRILLHTSSKVQNGTPICVSELQRSLNITNLQTVISRVEFFILKVETYSFLIIINAFKCTFVCNDKKSKQK